MAHAGDTEEFTVHLPGGGRMPLLGFGTWQLRGDSARQAVEWALEAGYRHLDTATMYGNEREVGAAVATSGLAREDVFVATKLPPDRVDRPTQTLEQSLEALGLAQVDLWLVHWPPGGAARPDVWEAFVRARADGLVRDVGVSNYSLGQVDELTAATGVTPAVDQVEWSPTLHDPRFLAGCRERGVAPEGYSPFRSGDLTDPVLGGVAEHHRVTPAQVVVRWHLQHGVAVIPRSARRERIVGNADVYGFVLDGDEMALLDGLSTVR
ncbi:MAG TPA: aldo/keto reductase [Jiangellales bacterium]|nr:aldo/keto reductase [Jiangellales bacterium]